MPTISRFYGITVRMHQIGKEHNPPHIHVTYNEMSATFRIEDGTILNGYFESKGSALVKDFIEQNKNELLEMWTTGKFKKLPPLR